jgi:hypothetical protein
MTSLLLKSAAHSWAVGSTTELARLAAANSQVLLLLLVQKLEIRLDCTS